MAETRLIQKQLAGVEDLLLGIGTATQARATGPKTITKINADQLQGALVIDTIDELLTLNPTLLVEGTCIVKDENRGGTFVYDASKSAINNGGTIFNGWTRQYDGSVSAKWFTDVQLAFSLGVEVDCTGVTFTPSVPYTVANNTTVKNGTFEAHLIDNSSYGNGVFNLISNNNIIFDGCTFKGYADINTSKDAHGISIDRNGGSGSNFIEIKHCTFDGISGFGIASDVVTGAFAHNWNIYNNTFKLYGINNIHAGVMAGIDLFSQQDISSQYIYDIYVHDNSFNITAGYAGVAYKVQGCVQSYVYNNVVYGGNVIDYSSSVVELYMKGHFYNNVISASTNIRSISIVGSNDLRVSNCSFINGINTYVNSRAGGINNLNITIENCNISGTSAAVSNGTNLKFKNCTIESISVSNIVGIEFKDCSISSFIWGASNSSTLVINKCRINNYSDNQTFFKSVSNSELSVPSGSYNTVSLYNGMYINNTFYGQEGAIAGAYCVTVNTGTMLVNNKYTYYNIKGNAKGSYSGYIKVDGEALKGSVTVRESIESFLSGVSTYTVYDVNSKGNIYVSDLTPSAGTFFTSDRIYDTTPSAGGYYGWVCTSGGTFGTLSGITASTTSGSATIVVNSTTDLWNEMFISIVGVTGTKRIKSISGTSVTLYSTCDATVSSAVVSYVTPVLKTFGAITA